MVSVVESMTCRQSLSYRTSRPSTPLRVTHKINMITVIKNIIWVLRINFKKVPFFTFLRIIGFIHTFASNLFNSFITGLIIGWVTEYASQENPDKSLITYSLIAFGIFYLLTGIINTLTNYGENLGVIKLSNIIPEIMLHQKLNTLSIETLENPEMQNKINRYNSNRSIIAQASRNILSLLGLTIALLIAAIPLFTIIPIATLLLIISSIPNILSNKKISTKMWKMDKEVTEDERRSGNLVNMIIDPETLKEIKLLNAYSYLRQYFDGFWEKYFSKIRSMYKQWSLFDLFNTILKGTAMLFALFQIINAVSEGIISVEQILFYVSALILISSNIDNFAWYFSNVLSVNLRISEMREVLEYKENKQKKSTGLEKLKYPPHISIKDISFKYPGSDKNIINNLSLEIAPGEKIAIVGENGAGKTTLVKLISNIYSVNSGKILVNGLNLNEIDPSSWYQNLGVLYQDFNMYKDLSVEENIALGRIENGIDKEKIIDAAKKADAFEFIEDFKFKFDQVLSEKYENGTRPSTGQWQKIAIARFFYRDSPVLILDEPTASIDAVAEANIFDRIYSFIENKTVIIISHRFSTVRNADRIIVFDKGQVVEQGSHKELVKLNGKYANAFKLQAKGYE
jgi:ATP-binding cassette subfamily B protein